MQQLRAATRAAHDRIELVMPVLDPRLTRPRYVRVLEALYGFYAPLEPLCARAAGADGRAIELPTRAKVALLEADLGALGGTQAEILGLPRARQLPTVQSASQAIGALYVLEGATLGGQIIQRQLQRSLGIDAGSGAAFFIGYGPRTRQMWMHFAGHLERMAGLEIDAATRAAVETFETLERWLRAWLSAP
jgi:heme oxygenase